MIIQHACVERAILLQYYGSAIQKNGLNYILENENSFHMELQKSSLRLIKF